MSICTVCHGPLDEPIFRSERPLSITSLSQTRPGRTCVFFCSRCGHLQSPPLPDLAGYYEAEYDILLDSPEEDHLYVIEDGSVRFRSRHQAETCLDKLDLPPGATVLDYGCAKGATARHLKDIRADLDIRLFDVSNRYVPFWEAFTKADAWATHDLPQDWRGEVDLIMSSFVLEHIADPLENLQAQASVLKPNGLVYTLVPNVYANPADLLVADHVNHFSPISLRALFARADLDVIEIDAASHRAALIAIGAKRPAPAASPPPSAEIEALRAEAEAVGRLWATAGRRARAFEDDNRGPAAIYGAGFYGTFIYTCLEDQSNIGCFIDRNPHLHDRPFLDRPVVAPEALDESIRTVYVGLNPASARTAIDAIDDWRRRGHRYFFL